MRLLIEFLVIAIGGTALCVIGYYAYVNANRKLKHITFDGGPLDREVQNREELPELITEDMSVYRRTRQKRDNRVIYRYEGYLNDKGKIV